MIDANIFEDAIQFLCENAELNKTQAIFYEPTSLEKSKRGVKVWEKGMVNATGCKIEDWFVPLIIWIIEQIHIMSPNEMELSAMAGELGKKNTLDCNLEYTHTKYLKENIPRSLLVNIRTMFQAILKLDTVKRTQGCSATLDKNLSG